MSAPYAPGGSNTPSVSGSAMAAMSSAPCFSASSPKPRAVLQGAEKVRLLHDHGRDGVVHAAPPAVHVGDAVVVRHLDHFQVLMAQIRVHHLAVLGMHRLRDEHFLPPGLGARDQRRLGQGRRAVVDGRVGQVHARQLRDDASGTRRWPAARLASFPAGTACTTCKTPTGTPAGRRPRGSGGRTRRRPESRRSG